MEPDFDLTSSQDWHSGHVAIWQVLIKRLLDRIDHPPRGIEIGSWEGRSAVYLLQNLCNRDGSELVCIDHFDLHQSQDGQARYKRFKYNVDATGQSVRLIDDFSVPALYTLLVEEIGESTNGFDFVYVDGSHEADDTLLDAELAWRLCREGALLIFDDYEWSSEPLNSIHHPKRGIDAFLKLHEGEFKMLHQGYQVAIQKMTPQRIGFHTKELCLTTPRKTMEYGMNIVLCTDEAYALPTAVAIQSVIDGTPQARITFYIGDCGLSELSKSLLYTLIPKTSNDRITLNMISMPLDCISRFDASWAKIEIIKHLPIERGLHLDSDVLVRHDLTELWNFDLKGDALGAALDIGYPAGPEENYVTGYFNAGVLLFDYNRIRAETNSITDMALARYTSLKYKDQDLLNSFFSGRWKRFNIEWNAAGLGTYALQHSNQRKATWPKACLEKIHLDPKIVHFTGPVHPSMSAVLDPYNQPFVAKPWGYAGSPGHPFAKEWISCVRKTPWREYYDSSERTLEMEQKKAKAVDEGCFAFATQLRPENSAD